MQQMMEMQPGDNSDDDEEDDDVQTNATAGPQ